MGLSPVAIRNPKITLRMCNDYTMKCDGTQDWKDHLSPVHDVYTYSWCCVAAILDNNRIFEVLVEVVHIFYNSVNVVNSNRIM